jgi:hypothetical protein
MGGPRTLDLLLHPSIDAAGMAGELRWQYYLCYL